MTDSQNEPRYHCKGCGAVLLKSDLDFIDDDGTGGHTQTETEWDEKGEAYPVPVLCGPCEKITGGKMTVQKLIERLQLFPPGAKVKFLLYKSADAPDEERDVKEANLFKDVTDNVVWIEVEK